MNKEDFRIEEYDGRFVIQKRQIKPTIGHLFFGVFKKYEWIPSDDGICWQDRLVNPLIKGGYDSLESAKARLEKILEEPKYHYL